MRVQVSENIIYKGQSYSLACCPFSAYIDKFGQIDFEMINTAIWRRYLGSWEIKENKLLLNDIHSSNKSLKDIFNTESPVFAKWYSGNLRIGIGDTVHTTHSIYHQKYLICEVVDGIILKEFFVEAAYEDDVLINFGKHKGRKIMDIIKGELQFYVPKKIIDYLNSIVEFYISPSAVQSIFNT